MASTPDGNSFQTPKIRNLRWWIGGLLFASTVINYIDRQTLSLLAPYLKRDSMWLQSWGNRMLRMYGVSKLSVIDVRALPLSRRPGFSKNILAATLKDAGIG